MLHGIDELLYAFLPSKIWSRCGGMSVIAGIPPLFS